MKITATATDPWQIHVELNRTKIGTWSCKIALVVSYSERQTVFGRGDTSEEAVKVAQKAARQAKFPKRLVVMAVSEILNEVAIKLADEEVQKASLGTKRKIEELPEPKPEQKEDVAF